MKTWIYTFADGFGCYWYNKPMGKRELAKQEKEHGPLMQVERFK